MTIGSLCRYNRCMSFARKSLGNYGEDLAAEYLHKHGYKVLERNVRTHFGEIDILAQDKKAIVVVEVKTKRGLLFGLPQEMVHTHKQHKLRQLALWVSQKYPDRVIRVDVVGIDIEPDPPTIEHLKNVLAE